jgi:hypothetical protein
MEATGPLKTPPTPSMTPDAIRSRARRKAAKAKVKKRKADTVARSERLDMRLTKAEKTKIIAKAKKTRRTVTSLVIEAIEKIK